MKWLRSFSSIVETSIIFETWLLAEGQTDRSYVFKYPYLTLTCTSACVLYTLKNGKKYNLYFMNFTCQGKSCYKFLSLFFLNNSLTFAMLFLDDHVENKRCVFNFQRNSHFFVSFKKGQIEGWNGRPSSARRSIIGPKVACERTAVATSP